MNPWEAIRKLLPQLHFKRARTENNASVLDRLSRYLYNTVELDIEEGTIKISIDNNITFEISKTPTTVLNTAK